MSVRQPPDKLNAAARTAWFRIHARLVARGEWADLYLSMLELTAYQAALYLEFAAQPGIDPKLVEETRLLARGLLVEMAWLEPKRANTGSLTVDGIDADIFDLCKP